MPEAIAVVLSAYNPDWPRMASEHAKELRVLGSNLVSVHHIGSTAVSGLAAKPIIDLMPVVADLVALDGTRERIEALGYKWYGEYGIEGRRYCTLIDLAGVRIAQLHFFKTDSPHVQRHLAFRDYLRANPEVAHAYENEKRRAREIHPDDSHAYNDEKAAWIQKMETKALAWYADRMHRVHSVAP